MPLACQLDFRKDNGVSVTPKKCMAKQALKHAGWCTLLFTAGRVMGGDVITGNTP